MLLLLLLLFVPPPVAHGYDLLTNASAVGSYHRTLNGTVDGTVKWIGDEYISLLFESGSGKLVGINQGFSFNYSKYGDDDNTLSYQQVNGHDVLILERGEVSTLNGNIVAATGDYERYNHGYVNQTIISLHPHWLSELTFIEPTEVKPELIPKLIPDLPLSLVTQTVGDHYLHYRSREIGKLTAVLTNEEVYDHSGVRLGTSQGYSFNFPKDKTYITPFTSGMGNLMNCKILFEDGETMVVFNAWVLYATGKYKQYEGCQFEQISTNKDETIIEIIIRGTGNNVYDNNNNNNNSINM
mmetsp:Transcript_42397/g.47195  ORF Transcript_42397/g.47195 Transcript_42397/m.47195 type:complete len:297 (+) Transcript_42397:76-966(+)